MNHDEAIRLSATERYLLGELDEDLREQFEAHFFECADCATDVRAAAAMLDQMKIELGRSEDGETSAKPQMQVVPTRKSPLVLRPAWAWGAVAALLAVVAYQNIVQVPHLRTEVAALSAPELVPTLAVKGVSRSDKPLGVAVSGRKPLLLAVDIPSEDRFSGYRLSLYTPASKSLGTIAVTPDEARDTLYVEIPARDVQAGDNRLVIEGLIPGGSSAEIATRHFQVQSSN